MTHGFIVTQTNVSTNMNDSDSDSDSNSNSDSDSDSNSDSDSDAHTIQLRTTQYNKLMQMKLPKIVYTKYTFFILFNPVPNSELSGQLREDEKSQCKFH